MRPSPARLLALLLSLALCLGACMSGGGTDTETLTGRILEPDGTPAAGAEVKLIPTDYDPNQPAPARVRSTRTDAAGQYRFEAQASGSYNLLVREPAAAGLAVFAPDLPSDSVPRTLRLARARVFYILLHKDDYLTADSGKAYFPGTDLLFRCEGQAPTKVAAVPLGLDHIILESRSGWRHDIVVLAPGDSLRILADRDSVTVTPL